MDKLKSCFDILYQSPALKLISCRQGSINGKNKKEKQLYS